MPALRGASDILIRIVTSGDDAGAKEVQDSLQQIQKLGENIKSVGANITNAGKGVTAGLTLPLVGAGVAAVGAASKFDQSMSDLSTLIGRGTDDFDRFNEGLQDMLKTTPKSADDLGASAYAVVSAGISDADQALNVLNHSSRLAVAGLGQTAEATDIMTSAINAFGLPAEDAAKISDVLFKTVKAGKTTVAELAQSFGSTAPIVASAGIKLEEFQAATAALTTTGLPASQAQNSLRQAIVSLQKPTKEMAELFKKAGIESGEAALKEFGLVDVMLQINDAADGNAEKLAGAWGSVEALGSATALTGQVFEAFSDTWYSMAGDANAIDEAFANQQESFSNIAAVMRNKLNVQMIKLGNAIMPVILDIFERISPVMDKLLAKWESLSPGMQKAIVVGGALVAALGPVLLIVGSIIGAIGTLVTAFGAVSGAIVAAGGVIGILGTAMAILLNPITLVVAAVVGLYLAWKNNFLGIQDHVASFLSFMTDTVWPTIQSIFAQVKTIIGNVVAIFGSVFTRVVGVFNGVLAFLMEWVNKFRSDFWGTLLNVIGMAIGLVLGLAANLFIRWVQLWQNMIVASGNALRALPGMVWDVIKTIPGIVGNVIGWFRNAFASGANAVLSIDWWGIGSNIVWRVTSAFGSIASALWNAVVGAINNVLSINWWDVGRRIIDGIAGGVRQFASGLANGIRAGLGKFSPFQFGTASAPGGLALVGERGPELINLPRGSQVVPNRRVQPTLNGGTGGVSVTINVDKISNDMDVEAIGRAIGNKMKQNTVVGRMSI